MRLIIISMALLLAVASAADGQSQEDLNKTDQKGRKQGHWIKKYANGTIMYEGTFKDDKPVGEFKRFNSDNTLKSVLNYSYDSRESDATIFYSNGFISSKGKYVDQMKEGVWRFYSSGIKGCLIHEESYSKNIKNGLSLKFYIDSTLAEKITYLNGVKSGEWIQNHPNGKIYLKANYVNDRLEGKFEAWYNNGKRQYSGTYKKNIRDGKWQMFDENGTLKYEITYIEGVARNPYQDKKSAEFFDMIEKNMGKIPDPEKTGVIR